MAWECFPHFLPFREGTPLWPSHRDNNAKHTHAHTHTHKQAIREPAERPLIYEIAMWHFCCFMQSWHAITGNGKLLLKNRNHSVFCILVTQVLSGIWYLFLWKRNQYIIVITDNRTLRHNLLDTCGVLPLKSFMYLDHNDDVTMSLMASQITSLTIVYSTVYSGADQRKLRVTGLCAGNSPGTGEFPAQKVSNSENVSIWWRHHVMPMDKYDSSVE